MKKLAILLTIGFLAIPFFGHSQAFMKGTKTVNLGVNTGYGLGLVGSVEAGVNDNISAGVIASVSGRSYFGSRYSYLVLGARGSYHLGKILEDAGVNMDKLDVYLGLTAGFRSVRYNSEYASYSGAGTGIYIGGHGGVRYQLNDKLGVYLEGGYPLSSAGVTFKF
jgi:hypothetical protein